jgi:AcrR family transcriptional regulator
VGRWEPDARGRLVRAAMELFTEQGFAATTVPEITARAGLTTRTFFRHFADKREVVYAGDEIPVRVGQLLAEAPRDLDPVALVEHALHQIGSARFDGRREEVRRLRDLVRAEPSLQERDAQKRADLVRVVRPALEERGADPVTAALLAEVGVSVVNVALDVWLDDERERPFGEVAAGCFARLRDLLATSARPAPG